MSSLNVTSEVVSYIPGFLICPESPKSLVPGVSLLPRFAYQFPPFKII